MYMGSLKAALFMHPPQPCVAGFNLDTPAMNAMINKFDPDNSGSLSLDEYIRACLFLQTAARTFGAFDPYRQGNVNLNFNQFVYACSHVS